MCWDAKRFWKDVSGASAPEYAMILAVVVIATLAGVEVLGRRTSVAFGNAIQSVSPNAVGAAAAPTVMHGGVPPPPAPLQHSLAAPARP